MSSKEKSEATTGGESALVPERRFLEFQDEGPWTTVTLASVARVSTEKVQDKDCIPMSITSGVGLVSQMEKFGRVIAGDSYKNYLLLKKHDFAYNKSATKEYPQGFIALYTGEVLAAVPNSIFTCFRLKGDALSPQYLNYLLLGNLHGRWLQKFIEVGARAHGSLSINDGDLLSLPVPVPAGSNSLKEQQKIADCLASADALIAAQGRKVEALRGHKKGLMQQLFPQEGETQPRLRFPEFQNAKDWKKAKLGNYVVIGSGDSPSKFSLSTTGKYALVKVEDLNNSTKYQDSGREYCDDSHRAIPINSIIFPKRGAAIELNKIRITKSEIVIDTNMMALTPQNNLATEFLYYNISNVGLSHIADNSTIPQINNKHIIPFDFLLPTPLEQRRIADCLTSLDDLIAAESQKLDTLKTHKRGLMQQLFPRVGEVDA